MLMRPRPNIYVVVKHICYTCFCLVAFREMFPPPPPLSSCHQAPPSSPNRIRSLFPDVSATLQSEGEGSLAASAAAGISVFDDGEWWLLEKFVFSVWSFIKMGAWSYALAAASAVSNVPSQILLFLL
ncbi:hypothetical protein L1987_04872 [Smallanthus sonchifolius]|uniref:Uncharacterized protein n=1 Tax=Smallanthus sonchifolius TaxID=185202 RepID=A0ACB9JTS9_9ASTR|nr:hypothetical protein L1987_04872 [Smallanthus sonchifolius]